MSRGKGGGRPTVLPPPWSDLAAREGGVVALAALLGVGRETLRRWASGEQVPGAPAQRGLRDVFVRRGLPPPVW